MKPGLPIFLYICTAINLFSNITKQTQPDAHKIRYGYSISCYFF